MNNKPKILIVDDDRSLCSSLQSALSHAGYPSASTQDSLSALQTLSNDNFGIALLDINMPQLDGISLARQVRACLPNLGIILISGYGTLDNAIEALKTGVYDFIKKPFKIDQLLMSIERLSVMIQLRNDLDASTEELRRSEERYRILIESTADAVVLVQEDLIAFHNKAFQELLGCGFLLYETRFSALIHADDRASALQQIREISGQKNSGQIQYRLKKTDGSLCWVSANTSLIDYQGQPTYISSFRDITPVVEIENLRKDMERMLRHDMRSQIIAIVGFAKRLIEHTVLSESQTEYCRHIRQCGMELENMIETYLDTSRLEQGPFVLKKESFNLMEVIKRSRDALRDLADRKNANINILLNKRLYSIEDNLSFLGDKIFLQNAFNNLLKNAIEASPKDMSVKIKVRQHSDHVEISIHNWSVVPEEIRGAFFEKYASAGKQHGIGLGTYMAKLVTESHGGDIAFRTSNNEGTTILINLPLEPASDCPLPISSASMSLT